jgi:penicillin-binding protein A
VSGFGRQRSTVGSSIARVGLALALAFGGLAAGAGWWQVVESPSLSRDANNPAVIAAARRALRGEIVDRSGEWLARNQRDANGEPFRVYRSVTVSPVVGYASQQFGSAGLENTYSAELLGLVRPDPVADLLKKFDPDAADPQDLTLALSLELQGQAYRLLGDDRGAVVMIAPRTGEVVTLASSPVYDANAIANPATSAAAFEQISTDDERRPLLPRATQGRYTPGSVFKIVTGLAALDSGAITAETSFRQQPGAERSGLLIDGFRVRDAHHLFTGNEALDFAEATEVSCNVYYALAGLETGPEAMLEVAQRLGFDADIPFDLPTEPSQLTNGGGSFGGFQDRVELANAAYGQGETFVTPLQMALVAAAVANDGVLMRPHLVRALTAEDGGVRRIQPEVWQRVVSADVARDVQVAMQRAVESERGRLFTPGADVPGTETAGKSGTAELDGGAVPHAWFIGFAPVDDPVVAIAVVVEGGGRGGERAAPLAGRMMELALDELGG